MKFSVRKMTSVTLLASMMLTTVSPPMIPVLAQETETEMTSSSEVETEMEITSAMKLDLKEEEAFSEAEPETDAAVVKTDEKPLTEAVTEAEEQTEAESKPVKDKKEETEKETSVLEVHSEKETEAVTERVTEKNTEKASETAAEEMTEEMELIPVQVHLDLEPVEIPEDGSDPKQAGQAQKVKFSAVNPSTESAELRLYFWDYAGEERNGQNIARTILTDVCEDVMIPECRETGVFPVVLSDADGMAAYEQAFLRSEQEEGNVISRYLEISIPAGYSCEESFQILDEKAETIVVSPVVFPAELETDQEYDKCVITWNEKPEKMTEETAGEAGDADEAEIVAVEEKTETVEEETDAMFVETETDSIEVQTSETEQITEEQKPAADTEDMQEVAEKEVFMEELLGRLNAEDFASRRLIVILKDEQKLRKSDEVINNYDDLYVIDYETVEECMAAYAYYAEVAEAVEPDAFMEIASDGFEEALSEKESASVRPDGVTRVIALLDTGASASANVIDRVSMVDDALEGHSHGNQMVNAIVSQNPDAQIMSVRVMGNDGRGTVSDIIAGMNYAMEHGASIINLSLSSRKNDMNAALEAEIKKAVSKGIIVVGAAGNNAADVMNYMPGSVEEAYIIGACNTSGVRITSSNYGATVDYNVIAGTTSEAAAKFSGCVSLAGLEGLQVNSGVIYDSNYVAVTPETDPAESETENPDDFLTDEELADMAGTEEDGEYPAKGSSISQTVKIWTRDTEFDFRAYNPYKNDDNVATVCTDEILQVVSEKSSRRQAEYICSLKDQENYSWNVLVTFLYVDDRSIVTAGSDLLDNLMPEAVSQERNAGYGGIVPEHMGETVAGREFTVLKGDEQFDLYGLLIDYNPETFKVNNLADDGGFDVNQAGTYTVTYEMSYFMYPEYTWFVANKVNVVEKENLEAGIYLTSTESTLMFKRAGDSHFSGYGDLVRVENGEEIKVSCIDADYEVDFISSSENVTADICATADNEDGSKKLTITIPEGLEEAVILSMYRPGYQSAKFFTGGGWVNGEEFNIEEAAVDQLTAEDVEHLEETVLGKVDKDDEEYMEIAAAWSNVETKNISGVVKTGSANTTNHSWSIGSAGGCNYGTAQITAKKNDITSWISDKGYDMDPGDLSNFTVSCSSGHDYLGLWPNSSYNVTFKCYIQKSGDNYRLKITCSLHPGSDSHGNYQGFYGSKTYSSLTNGARLRVYKRFRDPAFMDENPNKYGYIKTTFAIYPASAYNKTTNVLDTTVDPEGTIVLNDKEDDTVYGDSDILDPGTYYVVETRRIAGCTQNTDIYGPVVIKDTDSGVIKLHDKVNNAYYPSMGSNNWIYNDPMYFNGKILTKTDDSGLPVEGAIYKVEYSNATSVESFSTYKTWYFKTDASGNLAYDQSHYVASFTYGGKTYKSDELIMNAGKTVAMLPFGFLKIKEIMPPSDIYDIDTNTYTIELAAQKDAAGAYTIRKLAVKGNIPSSVDKLRYWKLTVEKASLASADVLGLRSYSLAGATFAVYTDQACTKLAQLYTDEKLTTKVTNNVFTTDEKGKRPTYYLKAGAGSATYYVKEQKAPAGHQLVTSPVPVQVTMPNDALKLKTASFTQGFSEPYDYMELDALVEKLSMHGNPVKGVVFKVCYYDDSTANAGQLKKTWYLVSDDNGKVLMDQSHVYSGDASMKSDAFYTDAASGKVILPIGGYVTMQEVKAPAQYIMDDTVRGFETKKMKVTMQRLHNETVPCEIRLKKYDKTGAKPLAGVQFELKFVKASEKDTSLAGKYTRLLKEGETKLMTTDKNGEIKFNNLDQGTYEITEVKTVAGQTLLKEKITVELPITMTKAEADKYGNVDFASAKEDKGYTEKWFFYSCLYEITNEPQFTIPQTGGFGGWKYGYLGVAILLGAFAAIALSTRKKRHPA
ncbi:SpaA isopeptide-forming pilin-related protein [Ruminococcus sp. 5_1_39BFAA]|uniref:SpaA isopeptide-forming pilin-related protein n=1 Tax=Ruminococcus sp. 5_1_39BFAA TaxID=457412 RepID=UPI003563F338